MTSSSESTLASVDENFQMEECPLEKGAAAAPTDGPSSNKPERKLSVISERYDHNKKGYLDPTETHLRSLDVSNRGYLTNDKVYEIMKEHLELQKQMVTQKRLIIGLAVLALILAIANMGTAFAAAILAKDTTVNSHGDLAGKGDEERVGTTAKGNVYGLGEQGIDTERRLTRHLVQYNVTTYTTISNADAVDMWNDYANESIPVTLRWTCGIGGLGYTFVRSVNGGSSLQYSVDVVDEDTNITSTIIGTKFDYEVDVLNLNLTISVDCQDGANDCVVTGTNCCSGSDIDCPGVSTCSWCGCTCIAPNTPECRMYSYCDGDFGDPLRREL